jgi:hypothetical protein
LCYWKTTHKFGIHLPESVKEALEIDHAMNTNFWRKAINKEMSKVKVAWVVRDGHTPQEVQEGKHPSLSATKKLAVTLCLILRWTS